MDGLPDKVGIHRVTEMAYEAQEKLALAHRHEDAPHGQHWHTSFHASKFPFGQHACERALVYGLMGLPHRRGFSKKGRMVMDVGKDVEARIVAAWNTLGCLISSADSDKQDTLQDPATWLSASFDAVLDLRALIGYDHVLPVDIKGIKDEAVDQIDAGTWEWRPWQKKYFLQVMVQAWLLRKNHWRFEQVRHLSSLKPCEGGSLYFFSREDPDHATEVFVPIDESKIRIGVLGLMNAKEAFEAGRLPAKPAQFDFHRLPCSWCEARDYCLRDLEEGTTELASSQAISMAKEKAPSWDYENQRRRVLNRWSRKRNTKQ